MSKSRLFAALAIGLLALVGWKAFSHFKSPVAAVAVQHWVCPMRCLGKVYDHPGNCPVCHMKLNPVAVTQRAILGYTCPLHYSTKLFDQPGRCPFCSLELKTVYAMADTSAPVAHAHISPWEEVDGKTAVYFRPYTVHKLQVDRIVRGAGRVSGSSLSLHLAAEDRKGVQAGASVMVSPASGYSRPLFGSVSSVGPGDVVRLSLPHALKGFDYAMAEIRVSSAPTLAVPQEALVENSGEAHVFVQVGQAYVPRSVGVLSRGESFVAVSGLNEGDVVAASGLFWLEAQWRMDHPAVAMAPSL